MKLNSNESKKGHEANSEDKKSLLIIGFVGLIIGIMIGAMAALN